MAGHITFRKLLEQEMKIQCGGWGEDSLYVVCAGELHRSLAKEHTGRNRQGHRR
jgi:hypothetical protein